MTVKMIDLAHVCRGWIRQTILADPDLYDYFYDPEVDPQNDPRVFPSLSPQGRISPFLAIIIIGKSKPTQVVGSITLAEFYTIGTYIYAGTTYSYEKMEPIDRLLKQVLNKDATAAPWDGAYGDGRVIECRYLGSDEGFAVVEGETYLRKGPEWKVGALSLLS